MLSNSHLFIGLLAVTGNSYFHLLFYPSFFPSVRRFSWNKPINFFFSEAQYGVRSPCGTVFRRNFFRAKMTKKLLKMAQKWSFGAFL